MNHTRPLTHRPALAQEDEAPSFTLVERLIVLTLSTIFAGNSNLPAVISNLSRFYSKT